MKYEIFSVTAKLELKNQLRRREHKAECRYSFLTMEIDFGRIESHTRPFNILVTAKPSVNRSALDCELPDKKKRGPMSRHVHIQG